VLGTAVYLQSAGFELYSLVRVLVPVGRLLASVFGMFVLCVFVRMHVYGPIAMPMFVFVMHVLVRMYVGDATRMLVFVGVPAGRG
jgi:hypothetical protein